MTSAETRTAHAQHAREMYVTYQIKNGAKREYGQAGNTLNTAHAATMQTKAAPYVLQEHVMQKKEDGATITSGQ